MPRAKAIQLTDENFFVTYENDAERTYHIDTGIGVCTCPIGTNDQLCKHQFFVAQLFPLNLPNLAPIHSICGRNN